MEHLELKGTPTSKPLHLRNDLVKLILVNINSLSFLLLKKKKNLHQKKKPTPLDSCRIDLFSDSPTQVSLITSVNKPY